MPRDVRRRGAALAAAVLLVLGAACSGDDGTSQPDRPTTADADAASPSTSEPPEPTPTASKAPEASPEPSPTPTTYPNRVICLPVEDAMASDITAGSPESITPVPGRSVAYQPADLPGTYLVVVVFTGPGRLEGAMGVWTVRRSIDPEDHGPIASVDRIARFVTSWPVARRVVEDDFRVSEVRACTLR